VTFGSALWTAGLVAALSGVAMILVFGAVWLSPACEEIYAMRLVCL
jgi:hypothetical protein